MTVFWAVMIGAGSAGLGYVIRMMEDGQRAYDRVIAQARADVADPCRDCPLRQPAAPGDPR